MIQDVARRIAQEKVGPSAEQFDKSGEFPLENIRLLGENGLMGIEVPAEYGGAGMDPVAYVLAMVEIAAADAAHSTIMSVNNSLFCNGILTHGTEAQKQKYVRAIAEGEEIGAFALTEPQSGSDATAMRCRAVKQADGTRSEEHTSELQSLMRISYAVFCLKKKNNRKTTKKSKDKTHDEDSKKLANRETTSEETTRP